MNNGEAYDQAQAYIASVHTRMLAAGRAQTNEETIRITHALETIEDIEEQWTT